MKLIEKSVIGKYSDQSLCEDGLFFNNDFAVVVDGVTSKGNRLNDGRTSGLAAKDLILREFETMPPDADASACFRRLDSALHRESKKLCISDNFADKLRAAVVVYSRFYNSIWMYGDCIFSVDGQVYNNVKKTDIMSSELRSILIKQYLNSGMTVDDFMKYDIAREEILPILRLQQFFENGKGEFGYAVINGCGISDDLIFNVSLDAGMHEIILASDGYPQLKSSLAESEDYLAYILKNDPLCFSLYKSTKGLSLGMKSFDDRTYLRFYTE